MCQIQLKRETKRSVKRCLACQFQFCICQKVVVTECFVDVMSAHNVMHCFRERGTSRDCTKSGMSDLFPRCDMFDCRCGLIGDESFPSESASEGLVVAGECAS